MKTIHFFPIISLLAILSMLLTNIGCSTKEPPPPDLEKEEPVKIVSLAPTTATVDKEYVYHVEATGTPEYRWELLEGPAGMNMDQDGNIILSAESVKEGHHKVKIKVSNIVDGKVCEDIQTYTLECENKKDKKKDKKKIKDGNKVKFNSIRRQTREEAVVKKQEVIVQEQEKLHAQLPEVRKKEQKEAIKTQKAAVKKMEELKKRADELRKLQAEKEKRIAEERKIKEEQRLEIEKLRAKIKNEEEAARRKAEEIARTELQALQEKERLTLEKKRKEAAEKAELIRLEKIELQNRLKAEAREGKKEVERLAKIKREEAKRRRDLERMKKEAIRKQEEARLEQERIAKKLEDDKRRKKAEEIARKQQEVLDRLKELEKVVVPDKDKMSPEEFQKSNEEGKKVKMRYSFELSRWSFASFVEMVRSRDFKLLFVSKSQKREFEVVSTDSRGFPIHELRSGGALDRNIYNTTRGLVVVEIPADKDVWGKYDTYLQRKLKTDGSYQLWLFFPHHFFAFLDNYARTYYQSHIKNPKKSFEDGAGNVMFTITKDYDFKILTMGNTR